MGNKAEYRSAIRSRKLIKEAFLQLLQEKDINKITVTDIVRVADINRATFYAHYPDVPGLVEEIGTQFINKVQSILGEFQYPDFFRDPSPLFRELERYLEQDLTLYRTLARLNSVHVFLEKLRDFVISHMYSSPAIPSELRDSPAFSVWCSFLAGGAINIYQQWLIGRLDCPLHTISDEAGKMISSASHEMLEQWLAVRR